MQRPSTSKPRGVCRYYNTPRGCLAGRTCKFLHGQDQQLTPYDQNKVCRYYQAGYCRRGADCWFRHEDKSTSYSSDQDLSCSVCYEKPVTYALLSGCSHVFCISCIRQWRNSHSKSDELTSQTSKSCPYCRETSKLVIPSSQFFPEGHPRKAEIIAQYKASMARVPCRHFQKSPPSRRYCPFGRDCFYQHLNDDGTPFVFSWSSEEYVKNRRRPFQWPIFEVVNAFRSNLPALFGIDPDDLTEETARMFSLDDDRLQDLSVMYRNDVDIITDPNEIPNGILEQDEEDIPELELVSPFSIPLFNFTPSSLHLHTSTPISDEEPHESQSVPGPSSSAEPPLEERPCVAEPSGEEEVRTRIPIPAAAPTPTLIDTIREPEQTPEPVYHNPNPPFATDGRGRVVWSNRANQAHNATAGSPRLGKTRAVVDGEVEQPVPVLVDTAPSPSDAADEAEQEGQEQASYPTMPPGSGGSR